MQWYYLALSVLLLLPLSLGIDGTAWGAQFSGWSAVDWTVLVLTSTVVYIGANAALQVCLVQGAGLSSTAAARAGRHAFSACRPGCLPPCQSVPGTVCLACLPTHLRLPAQLSTRQYLYLRACIPTCPPLPAQNATWRLGAPTVSLFFGARLVAAVAEQWLLLQHSIIQSGVQVGQRTHTSVGTSWHACCRPVVLPWQNYT